MELREAAADPCQEARYVCLRDVLEGRDAGLVVLGSESALGSASPLDLELLEASQDGRWLARLFEAARERPDPARDLGDYRLRGLELAAVRELGLERLTLARERLGDRRR